jgi:hypothetical protein
MTQPTATWQSYPAQQAFIQWTDDAGRTGTQAFDIVESETWTEDATVTEHPVEVGANVGDHVRVALRQCELKIFSSNEPLPNSPNGANGQFSTVPLNVPTPSWVPGSGLIIIPQWNNRIGLRTLVGSLVGFAGGFSGTLGDLGALATIEAADLLLPGVKTILPVQTDAGLVPSVPPGVPTATVFQQQTPTDFVALLHQLLCNLKNQAQIFTVWGSKDFCGSMVIEKLSFTRDVDTGTGESLTIGFKELRVVATQVVTAPIPHLSAGGGVPPVGHGGQNTNSAPATTQSSVLAFLTKN